MRCSSMSGRAQGSHRFSGVTAIDRDLVLAACDVADRHLAARRRMLRIPGVQAAVAVDGEVVWETAHGFADLERRVALTPRHVFRIASHSKTFTATAVLQLVEAGRLRLDDRLGDHVAGLPTGVASVTVRETLGHGGGLTRDGADADHWSLERPFPSAEQLLAGLDAGSAVRPANERFKYSNIGYSVLGLVIEAITGGSYAEAVGAGIIDRLGLSETTPELDPKRAHQYAVGYTSLAYADQRLPIENISTGAMAAATGFASTAADTARYLGAHRPGDERLLQDPSKRLGQRDEWKVERADSSYGLGFEVLEVAGRRLTGHSGGFPGFTSRSLLDPATGLSLSVFTNCIDGPATDLAKAAYKLIALACGLHRAERPAERHTWSGDLDRFTGSFSDIWHRSDVVRFGDRLWQLGLTEPDPADNPVELVAESPTRLRAVGGGTGFGSFGEAADYAFDEAGQILAARLPGGITSRPLQAFESWLAGQRRIELPT